MNIKRQRMDTLCLYGHGENGQWVAARAANGTESRIAGGVFVGGQYIQSPPCSLTAASSRLTAMLPRLMGGVSRFSVSISSRS